MINLFDLRKEQIDNDTLKLVLNKSLEDTINFDLKSVKEKNIIVDLLDNVNVTILNVDTDKSKCITFNLFGYSKLTYNIASFSKCEETEVVVNLNENSEFFGAYADFSIDSNSYKFTCNLNGRGSRAYWHLATLTKNSDKKTFDVSFYHYEKDTYAKMENYGVCEEASSLSFLGTSKIFKGAKRSATHQSAKIMVFDKKCNAKASPILCIDENDVQASHAAVVGQINEDHLFYLVSRGIKEKDAKKLITLGYLMPILDHFKDEATSEIIKKNIEERV